MLVFEVTVVVETMVGVVLWLPELLELELELMRESDVELLVETV